jgi:hypothetical protein
VNKRLGPGIAPTGSYFPANAATLDNQANGENAMAIESNLSLEISETHALIGSDEVEGTSVYRSNGGKIGNIARVMIAKQSGKVGYAVMSFGGFLGIGEAYYPLPWSKLTYNPRLKGTR